MNIILWIHPKDLNALHNQIHQYDEDLDIIKMSTIQMGTNWCCVSLSYAIYKSLVECEAIKIY